MLRIARNGTENWNKLAEEPLAGPPRRRQAPFSRVHRTHGDGSPPLRRTSSPSRSMPGNSCRRSRNAFTPTENAGMRSRWPRTCSTTKNGPVQMRYGSSSGWTEMLSISSSRVGAAVGARQGNIAIVDGDDEADLDRDAGRRRRPPGDFLGPHRGREGHRPQQELIDRRVLQRVCRSDRRGDSHDQKSHREGAESPRSHGPSFRKMLGAFSRRCACGLGLVRKRPDRLLHLPSLRA
jgi:hypothetical protein